MKLVYLSKWLTKLPISMNPTKHADKPSMKTTDTLSINHAENLTVHERLAYANIAVDKICKSSGVPGASIGVIHDGDVIHTYNFGHRDVYNQLRTTSDTVYGIGSVTKSFIAAGIARLVEDKKLTWDTPVRDILPEFEQEDANIAETLTIADILSHRSGLAGSGDLNLAFQGDGDMLLQKESLFPLVRQFKQLFPIRTNWSYFVWGYALAGAIIEKVTNQSINTFMSETIFEPLDLNNTTFDPNTVDMAKFAEPYAGLEDGTAFHLRKRQAFAGTFFEASGGIYSNLDDMLKWSKAMLDTAQATPGLDYSVLKQVPEILSSHIAIKNPSWRERSYGYGWVRNQLPSVVSLVGDNAGLWDMKDSPILGTPDQPLLMIYHQGNTVGYNTFIALFPDSNSAVAVLTNSIAISDAADWIGRVFIQALFDLRDNNDYVKLAEEGNKRVIKSYQDMINARDELKQKHGSDQQIPSLEAYVGRYNNPNKPFHIVIMLSEENNSELVLQFQGLKDQTYTLRHLYHHVFEWVLTHDEAKRRGRYSNTNLETYLFRFEVDKHVCVNSLTWVTDLTGPTTELFIKASAPSSGFC